MTFARYTLGCTVALIFSAASALATESHFGCVGLNEISDLPSLEGRDGVIFRINADLRMYHPFSKTTVSALGDLSRALAAKGTTLVYVPIPTKSVTMPSYLPPEATLYGFDLETATWVHTDIIDRLTGEGVMAVDVRTAMLQAKPEDPAFFRADFHWSAAGADLAAKAIGDALKAMPAYDTLETVRFETTPLQPEVAFSGMRRVLQKHCTHSLPAPETMTYETKLVEDLDLGGALDLFGEEDDSIQVALLGTSFSDSPINHFPGFLAQHSDLEVVNYAITGGNQFGAMTSYLTSREFADSRPTFLVWENPIYNNLAQFGDQPMRELVAAASGRCVQPLAAQASEDGLQLTADLSEMPMDGDYTVMIDTDGSAALNVDFTFIGPDGSMRTKSIQRGKRLRQTGRFFMPLSGLWPDGAQALTVSVSDRLGSAPELFVCPPIHKAKS